MTQEISPIPPDQNSKKTLNVIVAVILTALAAWMTIADFSHAGDLLFQSSPSILLAALFSSMVFMLLIVVATLPKRIIIAANLLVLARCAMGFPLNMWMDNSVASRMVSVAFLVLSLVYLVLSLKNKGKSLSRPWVTAKHSALAGVSWLLVGILTIPVWIVGYAYGAKNLVGDYAEISKDGVSLVEKVFEKDGRNIHLVGMMHIGSGSYYTDLKQRMNASPEPGKKRLVLTEGVSDRNHIIPDDFANGKTYERWAKMLGLESQKALQHSNGAGEEADTTLEAPAVADPSITWQNADMDVSDLKDSHREMLVQLLKLASAPDLAAMMSPNAAGMTGADVEDLLKNGLIGARNDKLMSHFSEMSGGYTEVYIPWGAAHLPDIEKKLLALGYVKKSEVSKPIVQFFK